MSRRITSATTLDNLRHEAKRWLKQLRAHDPAARARFEHAYPAAPHEPSLRDVQHALAREHGLENWIALKGAVAKVAIDYDRLARDFVAAFNSNDEPALQRLNTHYRRSFTFDDLHAEVWRRVYSFRQRASSGSPTDLELSEAQTVVAQDAGFGSWTALTRGSAAGARPIPASVVDPDANSIAPRRQLSDRERAELVATARERRIATLQANGMMTDEWLAQIADLDCVTALDLDGSRQLTDEGLQHLARMPQLQSLSLTGGKLTDRALEVLKHLPALRVFEMTWPRGITDAGAANLRFCDRLERVNLMGSYTGDGAIEALQGKPLLRQFSSGRLVTDAGLRRLRHFPGFQTWTEPGGQLLVDGPFTDDGLASLAGLEGLRDLDLFWHVTGITSGAFAHLAALPHLESLGADGELSGDAAMRHIAALPHLRRLRAQGTVATDEGFEALSRSSKLEFLWGRECPNLRSRGFLALSRLPALRSLGVSCRHVDDEALAALPRFPSLRELTPIDVGDDGFRHIGRCAQLERLSCMYCRMTTDAATALVANLRLQYYYAGLTRITDRSLELLGRMPTLEELEFFECKAITDAGIAFLAALPRLRDLRLSGLPGVTLEGTRALPARVRVKYST